MTGGLSSAHVVDVCAYVMMMVVVVLVCIERRVLREGPPSSRWGEAPTGAAYGLQPTAYGFFTDDRRTTTASDSKLKAQSSKHSEAKS